MTARVIVVFDRFPEIAGRMVPEVGEVVKKTAFAIQTDIQTQMQGPKTGAWYGGHQASAPGEAPAIDTGALVNSILAQMTGPLSAQVASGMEYAAGLEFGTAHIAPRPAWVPAADRARDPFLAAVRQVIERG